MLLAEQFWEALIVRLIVEIRVFGMVDDVFEEWIQTQEMCDSPHILLVEGLGWNGA